MKIASTGSVSFIGKHISMAEASLVTIATFEFGLFKFVISQVEISFHGSSLSKESPVCRGALVGDSTFITVSVLHEEDDSEANSAMHEPDY